MAKLALLIGISQYEFGLDPLPGSKKDVQAMEKVLRHPERGGFDAVEVITNPDPQQMREKIEALFADCHKDDLLLLYFSGHGITENRGKLYLTSPTTKKTRLAATAIPSDFVHSLMFTSPSRKQVVILDCCFSGAFAKGMTAKADAAVLTSSGLLEYSQSGTDLSLYTRFLVEGMETGAADLNKDGMISVDELHEYAKEKILQCSTEIKPEIYPVKEGHKLSLTQAAICLQEPLLPISIPPSFPDFYGRQTELEQVKKLLQASPVVMLWGESGVGKTYLAAQLAHQLSNDYRVCWLDREELTLEELLLQVNEFLKSNGEYGFVTTYAEDKIKSTHKIPTLVQVISTSKLANYAFFIDGFQLANYSEIEPFIQRFRTHGGKNRLILIDHSPEKSLGVRLASQVQKFNVSGFQYEEAVKYINQRCQASGIECSSNDVIAVIKKTAGHPLAIDLVIQWYSLLGNSMENLLNRLVEYDKRYGAELNKRLLENVAIHLDETEREALSRLSVFRTPVQRSAWTYLDISESVGESLLQRRLLTRVDCDKFQMHPLIAEFWRTSQFQGEMAYWQEKVAHYYWQQGKQSPLEKLDRCAYLESCYHWYKIGQVETAAQVLNDLVGRSHEKERLPSERLTKLGEWLLNLNDAIGDKPWLLLEKGRKLEKQGTPENAEEIFQKAYELFEQAEHKFGASIASYYKGKVLLHRHRQNEVESALKFMQQSLALSEHINDTLMQIFTLGKIADCHVICSQYNEAKVAIKQAKRLAVRAGNQLGLALTLYREAKLERRQSHFSEAAQLYTESLKEFEALGDNYRISKALYRLGVMQGFQGRFGEAETNFKRAIELKESINDQHGIARSLDYLADIYTRLGLFEQAEVYYRESLTIKEGNNDIQPDLYGQIKTYNNLARIALSTGRLDNAEELLQESKARIDKQNKRYVGVNGSRLIIQGDLQFTQGEYESALQSYTEAATCFTSPNPEVPSSYARVLFSLGQTYLTLRNLSLAKQYLEDSLVYFQEYRMRYNEALALTYLARFKALINLPELAYNQNQEAMNIATDIYAQSIVIVCLETQGQIEENRILNSFSSREQEKPTKDLIEPVWRCYDEAIDAIHKLTDKNINRQIARIQVHKKLWLFTVKYLCKEAIADDDAYGFLKTEKLPQDVIYIELLNFKYTLGILNSISSGFASRIADCALSIISPLAMRFGFNELREELEERAFAFLHPREYEEINQALESRFPQREDFIENLTSDLEFLLEDAKIQAEIFPRAKTIYSIYKKSTARKVSLNKILDIVGFRIITQTESECYKVLAIVQEMGGFFQGEGILKESLRDYIKYPKITGYQSIHINIRYGEPEARIVEFQIRTHRMHLAAEVGIGILGLDQAAHRRYKDPAFYARPLSKRNYELTQSQRINLVIKCEKNAVVTIGNSLRSSKFELLSVDLDKSSDQRIILQLDLATKSRRSRKEQAEIDRTYNQLIEAINEIPDCQVIEDKDKESEVERISLSTQDKALLLQELTSYSNNLKFIYLITPRGDVKKLPNQATPIDFAYHIHTDLGNQCAGARVNGEMVALYTSLKTGDIVEIITQKSGHPNLDWLKFVKTSSARNRIRQWYKRSHWQENIDRGRELLQKELGKDGLETLLESEAMKDVVEQCNYHSVDDLLANLGYGELSLNRVANRIREATNNKKLIDNTPEFSTTPPTISHTVNISSSKSAIAGIEGLGYHLAHCCNPVPGEPIIGVVKLAGRGISVHTQECHNWDNVPDDRLIEVSWNNTEGQTYPIYIQVEVCDEVGVLNNITSLLKDLKINIRDIRMDRSADKTAMIYLCIDIYDHKQIQRIFSQIKKLKGYLSVRRISQVR